MSRIRILFFLFSFLLIAIVLKLAYIQIIAVNQFAESQYLQTKKIQPKRGLVYDRNENPLIANQVKYFLYAEPQKINKPDKVIRDLDELLQLGEATLEGRIESDKKWVPITSGIEKSVKEKIEKLNFAGLGFDEEYIRYYPEGSASAHLLGFVGKTRDGSDTGYFGIEGYYEKDLAGLPGILKSERDLFGNPIFIGIQRKLQGEDGRDLVLTIDNTVQHIAKRELLEGIEKYSAKGGCVIIANPQNVEILGLVCLPDFDPEQYREFDEEYFKNPAISMLYEPGSIFKPLIMAAALEEKKVEMKDTYNEAGPVSISGYTISTWNNEYNGSITMSQILEKSSNVGMVYVGKKLGRKNLLKYLKTYGFGDRTGIDLQGEVSGIMKNEKQWYPIDIATVTFGQGIAVTSVQMIRAFSSLINGGILYKPFVVSEIIKGEKTRKMKPVKVKRVISEKTSKKIRAMLESTVEHGEAKWDIPEGYRIGGKTGTAQIPVEGKYDPTKTITSFIGFAPIDAPKFIALVVLNEPSSSPWGSETAAPLFFDIARELLVYYNIGPEK